MEPQKKIEKEIIELPIDLQEEVVDFIEFLKVKRDKKDKKKLGFSWIGGLKELRGKYTSVELQHKINEWRI